MATGGATTGGDLMARGAWAHQGHRLWASMSDEFWMYVYKVRRCRDQSAHDWHMCPYAHRGERARRRDPRRYPYLAVACPDFRASQEHHLRCRTGAAPTCVRAKRCRYAHGLFELHLHPGRFRTRMCDAGARCPRQICFLAHHPAQRRDGNEAVLLPGAPPLPRIPRPPPRAAPRQPADSMTPTRSGRIRFYVVVGTLSSQASVATQAPDGGDEGSAPRNGRRTQENPVLNTYPYVDLIIHMEDD